MKSKIRRRIMGLTGDIDSSLRKNNSTIISLFCRPVMRLLNSTPSGMKARRAQFYGGAEDSVPRNALEGWF
ncbi:hypothetical protein E2C01_025243 [Portunus trituberculatus]|uniref:Uncharacterized protein n=1 Tax=Portunus trituberculatus TaxID=210409 RepID=A0A5B7EFY8_PORTR|nr:hypothetical protein [Portunus trituberculatus]